MRSWLEERRDRFGSREVWPPALALCALLVCVGYDALFDITSGPVTCGFRAAFGLPCPGCGMTRSVVAFANGDPAASFAHHPLGIVVIIGLVAVVASWVVALLRNQPPARIASPRAVMALALAFAFTWVVRVLA